MNLFNTTKNMLIILAIFIIAMFPAFSWAKSTIRMAVTDIEGLEQLQREFGPLSEMLSKKTGFNFHLFPVASRTVAVEAMKSKKIEFALTGPAEYVVFQSRIKTKPIVGFSRPDYFCSIIVLSDSGITKAMSLKGKKVAMGSVGSTSKHLAPMQILKDNGLNPLKDVKVIHTSVKLGWEALKRKDVAAFATTTDKFIKLRANEKDFEPGAFRVIARGPDLPNDILIARPDVNPAIIKKVRNVFLEHSKELIYQILKGEDNQKYNGMKFITNVKDKDYDYVRKMYVTCGYPQFSKFIGD